MKLTIGHAQHIGSRSQQQDTLCVKERESRVLLAVADGMGGMSHGEKASQSAMEAFVAAWEQSRAATGRERLKESIRVANEAVFSLAASLKSPNELGTTFVAVDVSDGGMDWVSAGDSLIGLCRGGQLRQLNVFHTYGRELDALADKGIVPRDVVASHPERDALTSYLGTVAIPLLDVNEETVALQPEDWIVLATDGLFKTMSTGEIAHALRGEPSEVCQSLVNQTIAARMPFQDNVTVVALRAAEETASAPGSIQAKLLPLATAVGAVSAAAVWFLRRAR